MSLTFALLRLTVNDVPSKLNGRLLLIAPKSNIRTGAAFSTYTEPVPRNVTVEVANPFAGAAVSF